MNSIKLVVIFFLIILFSCTSKNEYATYDAVVEQTLKDDILDSYRAMLILPRTGCTGCISTVESLVIDHVAKDRNDLYFILTDVRSMKTAKYKLGQRVLESTHVHIDIENRFYEGDLWSLYPTIIYLDKGEISLVEQVSPENTLAIDKLTSYLSL